MACAPSENSGQPGHLPSLIRVFAACMKKPWVLSYWAHSKDWSESVDSQADLNLRWAHRSLFVFPCSVSYDTLYEKATMNSNLCNQARSNGIILWLICFFFLLFLLSLFGYPLKVTIIPSGSSGIVCLLFYGPVNTLRSCRAWYVILSVVPGQASYKRFTILSPVTDNSPTFISDRARMATEIISWPDLYE